MFGAIGNNGTLAEQNKGLYYNNYGTPHIAVGTRLVISNYAGPCMRVMRTSDSAQADFGFKNGWVDIDAVLAFVGAGSGRVVELYCQNYSGLIFTQTTAANRPYIVINGMPQYMGVNPSIRFINSENTFMQIASSTSLFNYLHNDSGSGCVFVACQINSQYTGSQVIVDNGGASSLTTGFSIFSNRTSSQILSTVSKSVLSSFVVDNRYPYYSVFNTPTVIASYLNAGNSIASNRSVLMHTKGAITINNTQTNAPSNLNATFNLTIGNFQNVPTIGLDGFFTELAIFNGTQLVFDIINNKLNTLYK